MSNFHRHFYIKLTFSTQCMSGRRTAWFPTRVMTQAGRSGFLSASIKARTASAPIRIPRTRSKADGLPPRWTWPRTVTLVSRPRTSVIRFFTISQVIGLFSRSRAPSATMITLTRWPRSLFWWWKTFSIKKKKVSTLRDEAMKLAYPSDLRAEEFRPVFSRGDLGDEDPVSLGGQGREKSEVATVPTHDLEDKATLMRWRSGCNSVSSFNNTMKSRVRTDCHISTTEVVVNATHNTDNVQTLVVISLFSGNST